MQRQMTIGKKLFLSFGAALVLTLAVSFLALNDIGNLGGMTDRLVKVDAKKQSLSGDINTRMADILAADSFRAAATPSSAAIAVSRNFSRSSEGSVESARLFSSFQRRLSSAETH